MMKLCFDKIFVKFLLLFKRHRREEGGLIKDYVGIIGDKEDIRDYRVTVEATILPLEYQIIPNPYKYVKSQGSWNSCASHAVSTATEMLHEINKTKLSIPLSERYHYYFARQKEFTNTYPENSGMTSRDMLKVAQKIGISPEKLCPYISNDINKKPGVFADGFAYLWKIGHYFRVNTILQAKQTLYNNQPILIGVYVNDSFLSNVGEIKVEGIKRGGHEIVLYGYKDDEQCFLAINSWGIEYKDQGCMKLPYKYVEKHLIDMWTFTINI